MTRQIVGDGADPVRIMTRQVVGEGTDLVVVRDMTMTFLTKTNGFLTRWNITRVDRHVPSKHMNYRH